MCILFLKSLNPNFGYVISKNPDSGMSVKSMRQGTAFGYYNVNDSSQYIVYFKDGDNKMSYKEHADSKFEYLNNHRYTSPIFVLSAINEFFSGSLCKLCDFDNNDHENIFFVNLTSIQSTTKNTIVKIIKYFCDYDIQLSKIVSHNYRITIKCKNSIYKLLNFCFMFFGVIACLNENDLFLDDKLMDKFVKCINVLNAPYYIRYLFCSRILLSKNQFMKFKNTLQTTGMQLNFGNTAFQRKAYIEKLLNFNNDIIDIGCGDGFYAIPFSKKLESNFTYHAIDTDNECLNILICKLKNKGITNVKTYHDVTNLMLPLNDCEIIVSEVVEHMERLESQKLISWVLYNIHFQTLIITSPNQEFNSHYLLENKFRHEDHKWEYTRHQFFEYIQQILVNIDKRFDVQFVNIGDTVDGISFTQAVIIKPQSTIHNPQ